MSIRSGNNPPPRVTTPTDPTLESRAPPTKRRVPVRSYGPGTAPDIKQKIRSRDALESLARSSSASQDGFAKDNSDLLDTVEKWENCDLWNDGREFEPDPTWGFYIVVTNYSQEARGKLDSAMERLLHVLHQVLGAGADPPDVYADELYRRLKFDVIEDRETLENASNDRVRECFRAHIRGLELWGEEEEGAENDWPPPSRNYVCLVLDGSKMNMLLNMPDHIDRVDDGHMLDDCRLKAIDIFWQRPEETVSTYRGARDIALLMLPCTYDLLETTELNRVEE
ncbi:hypothetical protein KC360_g1449 [Hortaea werneckii]|nr:hypothetical protein KC325_g2129 [Hortaea werneckii]KAI7001342.1 hypothetical protein KC359_g674 [Hortaea werneckii]KAI7148932.1 hypothetical protein KC344_g1511 [Hortaea werneckii]KAI7178644.1 hypothetical protein KC360_g1449 [Hortaea werneckii]